MAALNLGRRAGLKMLANGSTILVVHRPAGQAKAGPLMEADPNMGAIATRAIMAGVVSHRSRNGKGLRLRARKPIRPRPELTTSVADPRRMKVAPRDRQRTSLPRWRGRLGRGNAEFPLRITSVIALPPRPPPRPSPASGRGRSKRARNDAEKEHQSPRKLPERREHVASPAQRVAGEAAVLVHAAHEVGEGVEHHLRPDPGDEGDVDGAAIQVAGKVEQEHLEQHDAGVEHRAAAEIGDAVIALAVDRDPHRVDAVAQPAAGIEPQIGSRIAEPSSASSGTTSTAKPRRAPSSRR